ncbi:glutathione hydrolase 1 proenzyme-like isoform X3 [Leptopilina heterotoma]|uniref:glutathione hydrolase 1 proenzyme-like isoform X3 n=1 Tax=Leptopilina heterotoma TaxID=63436 RepID=UPI001CA97AC4|nr:glutathione hydrolase 1 proenzyme-like isoform X3 [Leptopilina heterotoma]
MDTPSYQKLEQRFRNVNYESNESQSNDDIYDLNPHSIYNIPEPPTEEDPLTKEKNDNCCNCKCSKGGFGVICCCFFILSVAITAALILQIKYGENIPQGQTNHGAVATDYTNCSQIGTKILRKGGNSIDAAIAATICMTVVAPHKTGLGGGGYMMIYNQRGQETPLIVDFVKNTVDGQFLKANTRIPAILKALELQQSLQGKLSWHELIEPSILLARNGFIVSREFANEISKHTDYEKKFDSVHGGETFTRLNFSKTLELIAQHGADVSQRKYTGVVAIDWQGTYVSIVTGLNKPLNVSLLMDSGFFLDTVDDFDELMSLTPILFHDNVPICGLSGSFNSDDPIVTGQILYNFLARELNLSDSIEYPRYYLLPNGVTIESDQNFAIDPAVTSHLNVINSSQVNGNSLLKSINMIIERRNTISSHSDSRGEGLASRF